MKIKTAVIATVVTGALVAGGCYGAYTVVQNQKKPVEVVPVSNVNMGAYYYGDTGQVIYGSVTSQVAQTVSLKDDYTLDEVYVQEGDEVKEGTPLFAYDMTLQELELEMEQLSMQAQELKLSKLKRDLEKYKNTRPTAALENEDDDDYTMSADVELSVSDISDEPENGENMEIQGNDPPADAVGEDDSRDVILDEDILPEDGSDSTDAAVVNQQTDSSDVIEIEGMEIVSGDSLNGAAPTGDSEKEFTTIDTVTSFETLVEALDSLFRAYGNDLRSGEVGEPIREAVSYYRTHLADRSGEQAIGKDGVVSETYSYEIKPEILEVLSDKEQADLETCSALLDTYQKTYVEMLIAETSGEAQELSKEELEKRLEDIQTAFDLLTTEMQQEMSKADQWQALTVSAAELSKEDDAEQQSGENAGSEAASEERGDTEPGQTETAGDTEPGQSETAGDTEPGQTEAAGDTEPGQTETAGDTEPEQTEEDDTELYKVTVMENGRSVKIYDKLQAGELFTITAEEDDETREFRYWKVLAPEDLTLQFTDSEGRTAEFYMPEEDVTLECSYTLMPDALQSVISGFQELYDKAMGMVPGEGADSESAERFLEAVDDAIAFYQQQLAEDPADIIEEGQEAGYDQYVLKNSVKDYILKQYQNEETQSSSENGTEGAGKEAVRKLENQYKELCILYTKQLFTTLQPEALDRTRLEEVTRMYNLLGDEWKAELEELWRKEQIAGAGQDPEDPNTTVQVIPMGDSLAAYRIFAMFQAYQALDPSADTAVRMAMLQEIMDEYLQLTDAQKRLVQENQEFVKVMKENGLWPEDEEPETIQAIPVPQTEPVTEPMDFPWGDDYGDGYTADELKALIEEIEQEIKDCELTKREIEISLNQKQRVVDGKIVKSKMDGTVISVGDPDGSSDYDYFMKIANEAGLYATGAMNELSLEKIKVGDTISGVMSEGGVSFTAVIKEISEYPGSSSNSWGWSEENTNASYYPFYALLDNVDGIEEGEAELQLSASSETEGDAIYLEKYFIRTESNGKSYVYKQGEDGLLTKQYVTTGKSLYGYELEILSGLTSEDKIAFPYGKNVTEGAKTKEVEYFESM